MVYLIEKEEEAIMSVIKKQDNEKVYGRAILSNSVKSHANDPFFIKKANEAKEDLNKITLPENKKK